MKHYFVVTFNDLSKEKQMGIKESLYNSLMEGLDKESKEKLVKQHKPNGLEELIEQACDKAWVEMEVDIGDVERVFHGSKDETSEDKLRTDAYLDEDHIDPETEQLKADETRDAMREDGIAEACLEELEPVEEGDI